VQKRGPTVPPPDPSSLNTALYRNIDALRRQQNEEREQDSVHDRLADAITGFAGSFRFVYLHLALLAFWLAANVGSIPGVSPWDPEFIILGMIASVEAIFLSTFVLISQNRMAIFLSTFVLISQNRMGEEQGRRAALDLQISLLAEHEVTRLIRQTSAIAGHLGVQTDEDIEELKRDIAPEAVLTVIQEAETHDR
jgi:uncharacterized membrane protein